MTTRLENALFQILRVGAAFCFIGHGAFGFITKKDWVPFFGIVGVPEDMAFQLMPLIGLMDVALGVVMLLRPMAPTALYMSAWAVWTALCRPLTGLGWWEFLERAGNYGVPLALVILSGWKFSTHGFWQRLQPNLQDENRVWLERTLRVTVGLLLIGHGGFGAFVQKPALLAQWNAVGLPFTPTALAVQGWIEISLGVLALGLRSAALFFVICCWKIATELLYPLSGAPIWEFIERAGSYASPLALCLWYRAPARESVLANAVEQYKRAS